MENDEDGITAVQILISSTKPRGQYSRNTLADKQRILKVAREEGDWPQLANHLGIKYKTAYTWVCAGNNIRKPKGGSLKKLTEDQINILIEEIERDPSVTLQQLVQITNALFGLSISKSTIHNYLSGRLISVKKVHVMPNAMNSETNKELRKEYVQKVSQYMRENKYIVWMDETNLNLFCRRTQGRARIGERAVVAMPNSKGPNIHVIGAISAYQVIHITRLRGAFTAEKAKAWVLDMLQHIPSDIAVNSVVVICDNAPCHSRLMECVHVHQGLEILKLGPYSPVLNPIENIWSKFKAKVKQLMRIPEVSPPQLGEQRLQYVENIIDQAMETITVRDVVHSCQHAQGQYAAALNMEDMDVGV